MRYLILGGTGTVGSQVVTRLLEKEGEVRVLTRSEERAANLPDGADAVIGDLLDPGSYDRIFEGVDRLFLLNAVSTTELHEGLAAVNESARAGVKRIVYLSVQAADALPHVPHFAAKHQIESALAAGGIPWTILRPNNFFQNDIWFRQPILEYGVYPQPLGDAGVSRVDVGDIADAAVRALTEGGFEGRTYTLVGPDPLTGEDCAAAYARVLDRTVRYGGNDLEAWGKQVEQMLPDWMIWDFKLMYRVFQRDGLAAEEEHFEETRTILGRAPRAFGDFVREAVAGWRG